MFALKKYWIIYHTNHSTNEPIRHHRTMLCRFMNGYRFPPTPLNPRQNFNFLKLDSGLSQKKQNFEASLWFHTKNDEFQFKAPPPRLRSSKWCFRNRNLFHQRHSRCKKRETSWADSSSEYLMKISCGSVGNECAKKKISQIASMIRI